MEVPPFYKARGREAHGERYIDRDGHFRQEIPLSMALSHAPLLRAALPTGAQH